MKLKPEFSTTVNKNDLVTMGEFWALFAVPEEDQGVCAVVTFGNDGLVISGSYNYKTQERIDLPIHIKLTVVGDEPTPFTVKKVKN